MYLIMLPMRSRPMMMSRMPARMVATARPSMPLRATIPATMVAKAAVGPAICTLLPPRAEIKNPATMAVYSPCSGDTPEARARAMDRGKAMIATMMPDIRSLTNASLE